MKQEKLKKESLDWDKVYINHATKQVFINIGTDEQKKLSLKTFNKILKKIPSINFILI